MSCKANCWFFCHCSQMQIKQERHWSQNAIIFFYQKIHITPLHSLRTQVQLRRLFLETMIDARINGLLGCSKLASISWPWPCYPDLITPDNGRSQAGDVIKKHYPIQEHTWLFSYIQFDTTIASAKLMTSLMTKSHLARLTLNGPLDKPSPG